MLVNSVGEILSQCICILNHHIVNFKYLTILPIILQQCKVKEKRGRKFQQRNRNLNRGISKINYIYNIGQYAEVAQK